MKSSFCVYLFETPTGFARVIGAWQRGGPFAGFILKTVLRSRPADGPVLQKDKTPVRYVSSNRPMFKDSVLNPHRRDTVTEYFSRLKMRRG
jgi:hypothetical protein